MLIDLKAWPRLIDWLDIKDEKYPSRGNTDSDVAAEVEKVFAFTETEIIKKNMVSLKLSKFYGNFLAVNQLSFCVEPGECFGL